jgi:hypothetical protein
VDIGTGERVDGFDRRLLELVPAELYHSSAPELEFDSRSDRRGVEPEGVAIGTAAGRMLAFVTLERPGMLLTIDVSDPRRPQTMNLALPARFDAFGPEGVCAIPAEESPLEHLTVFIACETAGRVVAYRIDATER